MDYHHDLSAYHADGSPPFLIWIWVFPGRRQKVVKHEGRSFKAEAVRSKVRLILCLIPSPTQAQSPFSLLRNCSYKEFGCQYWRRRERRARHPIGGQDLTTDRDGTSR